VSAGEKQLSPDQKVQYLDPVIVKRVKKVGA
jgi:hypothetical protein